MISCRGESCARVYRYIYIYTYMCIYICMCICLYTYAHQYTKTESRTACQAHTLHQNFFRLTVGADAGKPPFDQVSLTLYSLLYRFCTVKFSFLFGKDVVVSMNWMSIKPIARPQASNDTNRLASTRARSSSKTTNCQLQMHIQARTAKDRLESQSLNLHIFWVPARVL